MNNDETLSINTENFWFNFDSDEGCYRLNVENIYKELAKHQMSQNLLGKSFHAQLLTSDSQKEMTNLNISFLNCFSRKPEFTH